MEDSAEDIFAEVGHNSQHRSVHCCGSKSSISHQQNSQMDVGKLMPMDAENEHCNEPQKVVQNRKDEEDEESAPEKGAVEEEEMQTTDTEPTPLTRTPRLRTAERMARVLEYVMNLGHCEKPETTGKMSVEKSEEQLSVLSCGCPKVKRRSKPKDHRSSQNRQKMSSRSRRSRKPYKVQKHGGTSKRKLKNEYDQKCIKRGINNVKKMKVAKQRQESCKLVAAKCMARTLLTPKKTSRKKSKPAKFATKNKGKEFYVRIVPILASDKYV